MNVRTGPLVLGLLAFGLGVALLVGALGIGMAQSVTIVVGALALIAATRALSRRRGARALTATPDPEHRYHVPVPGSNLGEVIATFRSAGAGTAVTTTRIQQGLRGAAIAVLTRFEGLSTAEAETRLEDGTWTDDPYAAAFLSSSIEVPRPSVRERIAAALGTTERRFKLAIRRTAAAVAAIGYAGLGERTNPDELPRYEREEPESVVPRTTSERADGVVDRRRIATGHWTGIGAVALGAIGIGAIAESPAVVLAGVVGIGYAGFAQAADAPVPDLEIERTLSTEAPDPGEEVDVSVTITNEGDGFCPDLRLVDGVPAGLAVTDGSARLGTALRPGESVTLEYTVTARRGSYAFDPAMVLTRDLSRGSERELLVGSETTLVCEPVWKATATPVPLQPAAATFSGRLTTADGGQGTEFHSVRDYRKNDPLNRIDWNRHARTGELATLQFHEERAARVLVLVDARRSSFLAPEPDAAHAVDRSVDAASRIAATLVETGDTVGLAGLGPVGRGRDGGDADACWLAPSSGQHHRVRFESLLATHPQFSSVPPSWSGQWLVQLRHIRKRLSAETQIVMLSPLCDGASVEVARRLEARGHAVTVVSPDPTAERTIGQQLARVARRIRRFDLQRAGVSVVDWSADETIDEAFARTNAGGNR